MSPINLQFSLSGMSSSESILFFGSLLLWLVVLALLLQRTDLDPVTKLTWVIVVIFVPFFGMILYWTVGPNLPLRKKINRSNQLSGTPWEDDSSHTKRGKTHQPEAP